MTSSNLPADLATVAEQFAQWRADKTGHAKIPNELVPVTLMTDHPSAISKSELSGIPVKIILDNGVNIQCHLSKEMIYNIMAGGNSCCN